MARKESTTKEKTSEFCNIRFLYSDDFDMKALEALNTLMAVSKRRHKSTLVKELLIRVGTLASESSVFDLDKPLDPKDSKDEASDIGNIDDWI